MGAAFRRIAAGALFGLLTIAAAAGTAEARGYSAMMLDLRTGEVIEERNADVRRQPASLTKLMTLYLTFEAIETGQIGLDQKVRVSRKASRQPPSKLYLKAGQRVSIRHLIRATAIKSANDAAMVLAEAIGGSQAAFARMMTDKARQLGMSSTTFRNPHGLTQRGHLSTARDMAKLARAVYFHYPEYYNVFGKRSAHAAGKRVNTTNRLLRTYRGSEGMKTGYTRAAGYNLVATAKRGPRRVMAVLLGGKSSSWRWRKVSSLLDEAFAKSPRHARAIAPPRGRVLLAAAPVPAVRPGTRATGMGAIAEALAPGDASAAVPDPASRLAPFYAERPVARGVDAPARRTVPRIAQGAATPLPETRPGWSVQVGAFRRQVHAVAHLNAIALADLPMLARGQTQIEEGRLRSGKPIYKVRVVGLDETDARAACTAVRREGRDCLEIAPR